MQGSKNVTVHVLRETPVGDLEIEVEAELWYSDPHWRSSERARAWVENIDDVGSAGGILIQLTQQEKDDALDLAVWEAGELQERLQGNREAAAEDYGDSLKDR